MGKADLAALRALCLGDYGAEDAADPAGECSQVLAALAATAQEDSQGISPEWQGRFPEFLSPSLGWPIERIKSFYFWSMDKVTEAEGTVAGDSVCLKPVMLKAFC